MQDPVTDILVSGHEAQFESTMPFTRSSVFTRSSALDDKNIPFPSSFFEASLVLPYIGSNIKSDIWSGNGQV